MINFENDVKTIVVFVVIMIYLSMLISDIAMCIYNILRDMNKKTLGGIDIVIGSCSLGIWNYFFRDLVNATIFWIAFAVFFLLIILGIINLVIALCSSNQY